jgi:trk system potassium uptake protein TrkH
MHYREIFRLLSTYIWILIIPLLLPLLLAIYCDLIAPEGSFLQPHSTLAFIATILVTIFIGGLFRFIGRNSTGQLYRREALLLVLAFYFITPFISALPFYFSGTLENFTDAYFEATSGFTTTGATVMEGKKFDSEKGTETLIVKNPNGNTTYSYYGTITPTYNPKTKEMVSTGIEAVALSLLFWRSLIQWLGGCGFIVLFIAILPALGVGGKILYQTEMTGLSKEAIMPRIKETASQLWKIYLGLTLAQVIMLFFVGKNMSLFDAITISFSTISTGGFAPSNGGIADYHSAAVDYIVMFFMILGAINFGLYFFVIRGKFLRLKDPELRTFLLIILFATALSTWQLMGKEVHSLSAAGEKGALSFFGALRYGAFQVISAQTSTGFATANYDFWPFAIQVLLLNLMFVGGMGGSTSGGMKVVRQQTFFHILLNKIESIFRPDTVRQYRIGTAVIDTNTATTVLCFFMIVASLTISGTFLLVLDGVDPETSLITISCLVNNAGMGFNASGPTGSFAFLSPFGKWLSCIWMIAGRLEFYTLLIAFIPAFWRPH